MNKFSLNQINLFFILFSFLYSSAQNKNYSIFIDQTFCVYCKGIFYKNDSIITKIITDEKGKFNIDTFELKKSNKLEINILEHKCIIKNIEFNKQTNFYCLKSNFEISDNIQMEEITIWAKKHKIEDLGDKLIYNVDKDINILFLNRFSVKL